MEYREWLYASAHSSKHRINKGFILLEKSNNLLEAINKKRLSLSEAVLEKVIDEMSELGKSILDDMQKIKNYLIELDKIALKPRVFTDERCFKEMIEYEATEKNPGWENRVEGLTTMRDIAKHINDVSKAENISNLFPQYNNILKELKNKKP